MNGLLPDADFLSLLCSCAHLLAIEGNEVLILNLFWLSLIHILRELVQKEVGDGVRILDYTHDAGPEPETSQK